VLGERNEIISLASQRNWQGVKYRLKSVREAGAKKKKGTSDGWTQQPPFYRNHRIAGHLFYSNRSVPISIRDCLIGSNSVPRAGLILH
ncbi:unnamed protein product, partial [Heterotrigona itama]